MTRLPGNQIILRDWAEADLDRWRHWLDPSHQWHKLDGPYYPRPDSSQIDSMIERTRLRIESGDWPAPRTSLVIAMADTDDLIGVASWYWESQETNWLSLGIVIYDPSLWGRGIGFEALGIWSQYLFDTMPEIVRLDLRTWSGNIGMMRLAEKLGFSLEARFRMARIVDGRYFDGLGYGVLRSEWLTLYPGGFAQQLSADSTTGSPHFNSDTDLHPLLQISELAVDMGVDTIESYSQRYRRQLEESWLREDEKPRDDR